MTAERIELRVIAAANHKRPNGSKCKGAVSALLEAHASPTGRFYGWAEPLPAPWTFQWGQVYWAGDCPDCGKTVKMPGRAVNGRYSETVKCNAACQGARRPDCECSCAGRNHGAGFETPTLTVAPAGTLF